MKFKNTKLLYCLIVMATLIININNVRATVTGEYNGSGSMSNPSGHGACPSYTSNSKLCFYNNGNHATIRVILVKYKDGKRSQIGHSVYFTASVNDYTINEVTATNINGSLVTERTKGRLKYVSKQFANWYYTGSYAINPSKMQNYLYTKNEVVKQNAIEILKLIVGTNSNFQNKTALSNYLVNLRKKGDMSEFRLVIEPVFSFYNGKSIVYYTAKGIAKSGKSITRSGRWCEIGSKLYTDYKDIGISKGSYQGTVDNCSSYKSTIKTLKNHANGTGYNIASFYDEKKIIEIVEEIDPLVCNYYNKSHFKRNLNKEKKPSDKVGSGPSGENCCNLKVKGANGKTNLNIYMAQYKKEKGLKNNPTTKQLEKFFYELHPECLESDPPEIEIKKASCYGSGEANYDQGADEYALLAAIGQERGQTNITGSTNKYLRKTINSYARIDCSEKVKLSLPINYQNKLYRGSILEWPTYNSGLRLNTYPLNMEGTASCILNIDYAQIIADNTHEVSCSTPGSSSCDEVTTKPSSKSDSGISYSSTSSSNRNLSTLNSNDIQASLLSFNSNKDIIATMTRGSGSSSIGGGSSSGSSSISSGSSSGRGSASSSGHTFSGSSLGGSLFGGGSSSSGSSSSGSSSSSGGSSGRNPGGGRDPGRDHFGGITITPCTKKIVDCNAVRSTVKSIHDAAMDWYNNPKNHYDLKGNFYVEYNDKKYGGTFPLVRYFDGHKNYKTTGFSFGNTGGSFTISQQVKYKINPNQYRYIIKLNKQETLSMNSLPGGVGKNYIDVGYGNLPIAIDAKKGKYDISIKYDNIGGFSNYKFSPSTTSYNCSYEVDVDTPPPAYQCPSNDDTIEAGTAGMDLVPYMSGGIDGKKYTYYEAIDKFCYSGENQTPPCECPDETLNSGINLKSYTETGMSCDQAKAKFCDKPDIGIPCPSGTDFEGLYILTDKCNSDYNCRMLTCNQYVCPEHTEKAGMNCNALVADYIARNGGTISNTLLNKLYKKFCGGNSSDDDDPDDPGNGNNGNNGNKGVNIIYRVIELDNPFPGKSGNGREAGYNWNNVKTIKNYITNNRNVKTNKIYNKSNVMYHFKLTPSVIKTIRSYNSKNDYSDFKLTCKATSGRECISDFVHDPSYGLVGDSKCFANGSFNKCRN